MALAGGGAEASPATVLFHYPDGPGLAILFADESDPTFTAERNELARVLPFLDFEVRVFDGKDIESSTYKTLQSAYKQGTMTRVLIGYTGHGGRSEHADGSEGFLCGQGAPVDIKALQRIVDSCVPKGTPKLFVLDCCYSNAPEHAPPALPTNPSGECFHDISCLRASSPGFYGYYNKLGPSAGLTAFLTRTLDDMSPRSSVSWNDLKGLIAPLMKEFVKDVEPRLDCLDKHVHFTKVSWIRARDLLRAEKMALAMAAVGQIEFAADALEGLLRDLEPTEENLTFAQERSHEATASIAELKTNPFNSSHISALDNTIADMVIWCLSSSSDKATTCGAAKFGGIKDAAFAVLRAHAAF